MTADDKLRALADDAIRARDTRLAVNILTALIRKNPADFDAVLKRAEVYHAIGETGAALAGLGYVIKLNPSSPLAYFRRAIVLQDAGKLLRAEADVSKALEICPDMHEARLWRAAVRLTIWNCDEAIEDCKYVLAKNPDDPGAIRLLAIGEAKRAELEMVRLQKGGDVVGAWWRFKPADVPESRPMTKGALAISVDPALWPAGATLKLSIEKPRPRKDKPIVKEEPAAEVPPTPDNQDAPD